MQPSGTGGDRRLGGEREVRQLEGQFAAAVCGNRDAAGGAPRRERDRLLPGKPGDVADEPVGGDESPLPRLPRARAAGEQRGA